MIGEKRQDDISQNIEGGGVNTVSLTATELLFTDKTLTIIITAGSNNSGLIYVGKSDVTSAGANAITFIDSGESVEIDYDDSINAIFVVGDKINQSYTFGATV